jgi:DNA repair protein RadC
MALIDEQFMAEVGLGEMPAAEKQAFMEQATEELEVRVGRQISAGLSLEQMREFEQIEDSAEITRWLNQNVPNFREEVMNVLMNFKQELMQNRRQILA